MDDQPFQIYWPLDEEKILALQIERFAALTVGSS